LARTVSYPVSCLTPRRGQQRREFVNEDHPAVQRGERSFGVSMSPWSSAYVAVLALNVLWFGMASWYFTVKSDAATKLLVPKSARDSPLFATLSASVRFLGAMNFAFMALAVLLLLNLSMFPEPRQRALLACVFAIAHAGQFLCNVPIARAGGRRGDSLWPVLSGPMFFIFVVDLTLALANAVVSAGLF